MSGRRRGRRDADAHCATTRRRGADRDRGREHDFYERKKKEKKRAQHARERTTSAEIEEKWGESERRRLEVQPEGELIFFRKKSVDGGRAY